MDYLKKRGTSRTIAVVMAFILFFSTVYVPVNLLGETQNEPSRQNYHYTANNPGENTYEYDEYLYDNLEEDKLEPYLSSYKHNEEYNTGDYGILATSAVPVGATLHRWALDGSLDGATVTGYRPNSTGGNIAFAPGHQGQAAVFDGNSGLNLGSGHITSSTFTISFWVNPQEVLPYFPMFFVYYPTRGNLQFVTRTPWSQAYSHVWIYANPVGGGHPWFAGNAIPANQWSHMAIAVDGNTLTYYINNVPQTGWNPGMPDVLFGSDGPTLPEFFLGVNWWNPAFTGMMQEVRIYDNALLTPAGITALFNMQEPALTDIIVPTTCPPEGCNDLTCMECNPPLIHMPVVPARVNAPGTLMHGAIHWQFTNSLDGAIAVNHLYGGIAGGWRGRFNAIISTENVANPAAVVFVEDRHGTPYSAVHLNPAASAGTTGLYLGTGIIDNHNYTIAFWVNPQRTATPWGGAAMNNSFGSMFFGTLDSPQERWISTHAASSMRGTQGGLGFWSGTLWSDNVTTTPIVPNVWQHVAFTVEGGVVSIYLNGVPLEQTYSGVPGPVADLFSDVNNPGHFFFGFNMFNDPRFRGAIDDLMVFNRVLSATEVRQLHDPFYVPQLPPQGEFTLHHWTFDGNLTGTEVDATVVGNAIGVPGGNITFAPGRIGQAAVFDGNSGINLGNEIITSPTYTISMWVNPSQFTGATPAFFAAAERDRFIAIVPRAHWDPLFTHSWFNNWGRPWWHIGSGSGNIIPLNEWSHLALTVFCASATPGATNTTARLYINGVFDNQVTNHPNLFQGAAWADFMLGVNFGYEPPFEGMMQDVRIYDNAMITSAGIAALAAGNEPAPHDIVANVVRLPYEVPAVPSGVLAPTIPARDANGALAWEFNNSLGGAIPIAPVTGTQADNFNNIVLDRPENTTAADGITFVPNRHGEANSAVRLDGTAGLYLGAGLINTQNYTIAMWVRPEIPGEPGTRPALLPNSNRSIFAGGVAQNQHIMIHGASTYGGAAGSGNFGFRMDSPARNYFADTGLTANEWQHIAVVVSSGRASLYVNGVRRGTSVAPGATTWLESRFEQGLGHFFLGMNHVPAHDNFVGAISDVKIFDGALTAQMIYEMFDLLPDPYRYMLPGANMAYTDPPNPVFGEVTIHDPSLLRQRAANGWFYAIGTNLGAARTRDFMYWESVNYGAYPQRNNTNGFWAFMEDNPDPAIETMYDQIYFTGAYHPANPNTLILWASEIIEVNGRFFHYYSLSAGIGEGRPGPLASIGVAVADCIEGPWFTNGRIAMSGGANRWLDGVQVKYNYDFAPGGANTGRPGPRGARNLAMWAPDGATPPHFDPRIHPNTIDASPFFCSQGRLWMVYGSYDGGMFLLELCKDTGLAICREISEINRENDGYGRLLLALTHHSGEGPHMIFSETSGYYYMFITMGWLASYGGYHVRMFRSRYVWGPFEDSRIDQVHVQANPLQGGGAARWLASDGEEFVHGVLGNRMLAGVRFVGTTQESHSGTGHLSPGHGGMIHYDDMYLKVFHTRFTGQGEGHRVRVHEAFMNCNGWFVLAPLRFDGGQGARSFSRAALVGDFKVVELGRQNAGGTSQGNPTHTINSVLYRFESNGDITDSFGTVVGAWELGGTNIANITLNGITYNGVFLRQFDEDQQTWVQTFTAMSYDNHNTGNASTAGLTIWGVGVSVGVPYEGECEYDCECELCYVPFVPVVQIGFVPNSGTVGVALTLAHAVVSPHDATNQNIVWSVISGPATINGNIVTATAVGDVVVRATIANGISVGENFTQDFTINFVEPPPILTFTPGNVVLNDTTLSATSIVGGTATGTITLDYTAPTGITVDVDQTTGVINVTGIRPAPGQPAINETFEITVTRDGVDAVLTVTVNLTPQQIILPDPPVQPPVPPVPPVPPLPPPTPEQAPLQPLTPWIPRNQQVDITIPPDYEQEQYVDEDDTDYGQYDDADYDEYDAEPPIELPQAANTLIFTNGHADYVLNGQVRTGVGVVFIEAATDRMMIPLRTLSEALGMRVEWDSATRSALIHLPTGTLVIPADEMLPDGMGSVIIVEDRIFVPLRFVMYAFDANVEWDSANRAAIITW